MPFSAFLVWTMDKCTRTNVCCERACVRVCVCLQVYGYVYTMNIRMPAFRYPSSTDLLIELESIGLSISWLDAS